MKPCGSRFLLRDWLAKTLLVGCLLLGVGLTQVAASERFAVNMQEVELADFIASVERITGHIYLVDPRVRGRVTLRSQQRLTAEEVYQVFLSQLRVQGFALVPLADNRYRIVPEQTARLESIPVEGESGPNSDGQDLLATRVISLQHSDAAQVVNILTPLMDRRIGVISHYAPTNLLILTDWGTNLERLTHLVRRIDQASSDQLSVIPLEHAAATEMQNLLTQLLRREGQSGQPPEILADTRLNLLLVRGDLATRQEVERLVLDLDQPVERSANTQVFYLRHAKANEMVGLLQALVQDEEQSGQTRRMTIQAHESTNALVIAGSPDQLREMRLVIEQLDIRRAQVLVEAIIVEMSESRARDLGVQWLFWDQSGNSMPLISSNFPGNAGGAMNAVTGSLLSGNTSELAESLSGLQGITGGVGRLSSRGLSFGALLNALQSESDFNILSTPSLLTLDNAEATILVGQEVPFVTGSTIGDNNTNPFQTIQRREVGVRLQIRPQINDGNSVRLEIEQEVSNIEDSSRASDIITNKREIRTTVMADDQDIIVLGGLIREDEQEIRRQVPWLGDLPWIGALFRSTSIQRENRNLMVFIQPRIVQDREALLQVSGEKYRYMQAAQLLRSGARHSMPDWPYQDSQQGLTLQQVLPSRREQLQP